LRHPTQLYSRGSTTTGFIRSTIAPNHYRANGNCSGGLQPGIFK
jgi:hypothetical protein